jgi:branched-chain amino acid transport system ATP-binding protein
VLRADGVTKRFGAHTAVDHVDLAVQEGRLHAIIGPNGAGKTTLFNLLSGDLAPTSGTIRFRDRDITALDTARRSHLGIGRSFQRTNVFRGLTVFENVRVAAQSRIAANFDLWRPAGALSGPARRAEAVLDEIGLGKYGGRLGGELAGGDQRLLELAITLATDPVLLLLDEPTQGLSPEDATRLIARIGQMARRYTIVLIEHNMNLVMQLSDEITVLHFGSVLAHGTPDEIRTNRAVRDAYLGSSRA